MTYPLKFREKVFATKDKFDLTFEETSRRFDIPVRTLFRWQRKLEPCTTRNKPATKIDMDALAKDVEMLPDAYLRERAERFNVRIESIFYALKRLGVSVKKKHSNIPRPTKKHVQPLEKLSRLTKLREKPLFTWMKVVLPRVCRELMAIRSKENVVMGFTTGKRKAERMPLVRS